MLGRVRVKCIFKKNERGYKKRTKRKIAKLFFRFEGKILKLRSFFKMRKKIFRSESDFLFFGDRLNFFVELKNSSRFFVLLFLKSNLEEIALAFSSTPTAQVPPEDVFLMIYSIPLGRSMSLRRKRFSLTKRNRKVYIINH